MQGEEGFERVRSVNRGTHGQESPLIRSIPYGRVSLPIGDPPLAAPHLSEHPLILKALEHPRDKEAGLQATCDLSCPQNQGLLAHLYNICNARDAYLKFG